MKSLLWILTLFVLAVAVSFAARFNDGYVLFVLPPYRTEISLNLAVLLSIAAFGLFYAVVRGLSFTLSLPRRVRAYRERRQREKSAERFYELSRLIFEGRYEPALKQAEEAHAAGQSPALAALFAARSAQGLEDDQAQKTWLAQAVRDDPKMEAACLTLEAETLIERGRFDEASSVLHRLEEKSGRHAALTRLERLAETGRERVETPAAPGDTPPA